MSPSWLTSKYAPPPLASGTPTAARGSFSRSNRMMADSRPVSTESVSDLGRMAAPYLGSKLTGRYVPGSDESGSNAEGLPAVDNDANSV